ncbi:MAG TPA: hypothetical protein VJB82_02330 [Candidatus Peribacterales bacterium]|nr:hypothetical protein [Candidatus Peribacterales bacterium]
MSDEVEYNDDDLVYVDPETRTVVKRVEVDDQGNTKPLVYQSTLGKERWRKFYPWGTFRSMKKTYRIGGKRKELDGDLSLDEALPRFFSDTL